MMRYAKVAKVRSFTRLGSEILNYLNYLNRLEDFLGHVFHRQ